MTSRATGLPDTSGRACGIDPTSHRPMAPRDAACLSAITVRRTHRNGCSPGHRSRLIHDAAAFGMTGHLARRDGAIYAL